MMREGTEGFKGGLSAENYIRIPVSVSPNERAVRGQNIRRRRTCFEYFPAPISPEQCHQLTMEEISGGLNSNLQEIKITEADALHQSRGANPMISISPWRVTFERLWMETMG
jgi:hypothetical protein